MKNSSFYKKIYPFALIICSLLMMAGMTLQFGLLWGFTGGFLSAFLLHFTIRPN